jgi:hypothetical protein
MDDSGVGIDPARNVERQHRAIEAIDRVDQFGILPLDRARDADAEQRVDGKRKGAAGNFAQRRATVNPSPPLLPGPQKTSTGSRVPRLNARATLAAAAAARSMSGGATLA